MCAFSLASAGTLHAADPDTSKPYQYHVVLRIAPHRLLTRAFRQQLRGDLQDGVQAAFGPVAIVSVQDAGDWLDPAELDTHSEIGPAKRHYVDVSFADGRYVVRGRQHDGSTGMASPVVREVRTPDRQFVGRLIMRMIDQDFGAVGTVVGFDKATDRAVLALKAGELATADWARLVPVGSVFMLARVEGSPARGRPVDSAYLISLTEPKDGRVECRFVYRFTGQLADWPAVTFRALRLGTAAGPVRLRLADRNGLPPPNLQVRVSPNGFRPTDAVRDQGAVRGGVFDTANAYDRMAFVLVSSGDQKLAQVPVPVVDDQLTFVRVTPPAAGGEARQQLEIDARNVHQRYLDILRRLQEQNVRLKDVAETKRHQQALEDVKRGLDVLDTELGVLSQESTRLGREAERVQSGASQVLEQCRVFAGEIRKRREALFRWQDDLERAIKDEASQEPQRQDYLALLQKATALREEAEFDEAIKVYKEILNRHGERPEVRKLLDKLEEEWKLKGEEHAAARSFAYGEWSRVRNVEDVRAALPKAAAALAACKRVGDRLTARKLLLATTVAAEVVIKAVEELEKSQSDVDKLNLQQVQKVNDDLQAFIRDVNAFVRPDDKRP